MPNCAGFLLVAASEISILRDSSGGMAAKKSSLESLLISLATRRARYSGLALSPLLTITYLQPMGFFIVLSKHSLSRTFS